MAKKIGNVTYPDTIQGILDDSALCRAFWAYVKRNRSLENLKMIAVVGVASNEIIWERFISPDGPDTINISSSLRKRAIELAGNRDWDHKDWKGIISGADRECRNLLDLNYKHPFFSLKTPEFVKVHCERAAANLKSRPSRVAKLLGIADVPTLKALMVAAAGGFPDEATALVPKLKKAEKKKDRQEDLLGALKAYGFA